ncbi:MAG: hypothetical protein HC849_28615, partial [Oscillatoriales cyanobacterium RU_3_3]|nr:hypothetical protein [Oscillatoriales cyanobacterium RU_3_3]
GPVEWLLTGHYTEHAIPNVLPALGDDLAGFAARVKEARLRLGFTLADVERLRMSPLFKEDWLRWESDICCHRCVGGTIYFLTCQLPMLLGIFAV